MRGGVALVLLRSRFTQQDPIGLAGGLNLYGFAAGDPVNFSDPLGLCAEIQKDAYGKCPEGGPSTAERLNNLVRERASAIATRAAEVAGAVGNASRDVLAFLAREAAVQGAMYAATGGFAVLARGAQVFGGLFRGGSVAGRSVQQVRRALRAAGFEAGAVESGAGEMWTAANGANARIMFTENGAFLRIQLPGGNYLNAAGRNAASRAEGHIPLIW